MSLVLSGDSPNLSSPTITGAVVSSMASSVITSGTAVASTSGTSIDFTGIPSWVKKITVMFNGVSTSATSPIQIQLGDSGGIENTGYTSNCFRFYTSGATTSSTTGFVVSYNYAITDSPRGLISICLQNSNQWVCAGVLADGANSNISSGVKSLSATLDRIRITTVNGTDTFDAGSINILYE